MVLVTPLGLLEVMRVVRVEGHSHRHLDHHRRHRGSTWPVEGEGEKGGGVSVWCLLSDAVLHIALDVLATQLYGLEEHGQLVKNKKLHSMKNKSPKFKKKH